MEIDYDTMIAIAEAKRKDAEVREYEKRLREHALERKIRSKVLCDILATLLGTVWIIIMLWAYCKITPNQLNAENDLIDAGRSVIGPYRRGVARAW